MRKRPAASERPDRRWEQGKREPEAGTGMTLLNGLLGRAYAETRRRGRERESIEEYGDYGRHGFVVVNQAAWNVTHLSEWVP